MLTNFENTALIQSTKGNWKYGHFGSEPHSIIWNDQLVSNTNLNPREAIIAQLSIFTNIIVLPDSDTLDTTSDKDTVILITKGTKQLFSELYPILSDSFWEITELTNNKGKIDFELTEPEINKALRFVFSKKPSTLIACLTNSIFNSLHEKNLMNVLKVAGYQAHINKFSV